MKINYFLAGILALVISACNNENLKSEEDQLTVEIKQDLKERFEGAEIKSVHNWIDSRKPGTEVNLIDKDGNEVYILYSDYQKPSHIATKFGCYDKLPATIKYAFQSSPYGQMSKDEIENIVCDDYALLPHKVYKIEFSVQTAEKRKLYTLLTFNEDGYMLPISHNGFIKSWICPLAESDEINFIHEKYGTDIRNFICDGGYNSYQVLDHDVLKKIQFEDKTWKETIYPLPLETEIPASILEDLYKAETGFIYTQLYKIETPSTYGYQFLNEKGNGYIIMHPTVK